jgi:hypothetical protein
MDGGQQSVKGVRVGSVGELRELRDSKIKESQIKM